MSEINLDKKVTIKNIAPWIVGFPNVSGGDTIIAESGTTRIKVDEIVAQIQRGNKLFGIDEYGSHATIYIEDEETRKYLEFDSEDGKRTQNVISKEKIQKWFELKTMSAFEKNIKDNVKTRAEKQYLLKCIKDLKLDSYEKVMFCELYCKFMLREI